MSGICCNKSISQTLGQNLLDWRNGTHTSCEKFGRRFVTELGLIALLPLAAIELVARLALGLIAALICCPCRGVCFPCKALNDTLGTVVAVAFCILSNPFV